MDLIVLPAEALGYPKASPLLLMKDLEGPRLTIEIVLRDLFKHRLWKHDMSVVARSVYLHVREDPGRIENAFCSYLYSYCLSEYLDIQAMLLAWQFGEMTEVLPIGIVDQVNEFIQTTPLFLSQQVRTTLAALGLLHNVISGGDKLRTKEALPKRRKQGESNSYGE